jgi:hypothetical protein
MGHEPHSSRWNGERETGTYSRISPEEEDPESDWMQEFSLWIRWKEVDYDGFVVRSVWTSIEPNSMAQSTCHQEKRCLWSYSSPEPLVMQNMRTADMQIIT